MTGDTSSRGLDLLYAVSLFFIWTTMDYGLALRIIPQFLSHRLYIFTVQGLLPLAFAILLLGRNSLLGTLELLRIRTLGRYASLTMISQALTDPAWCILLGLNPINPFGDWRYPRIPMPTYVFLALRLIPSITGYFLSTAEGCLQKDFAEFAKKLHLTLSLERVLSLVIIMFLLELPFIFFPP
jgi:hypothetical protein